MFRPARNVKRLGTTRAKGRRIILDDSLEDSLDDWLED